MASETINLDAKHIMRELLPMPRKTQGNNEQIIEQQLEQCRASVCMRIRVELCIMEALCKFAKEMQQEIREKKHNTKGNEAQSGGNAKRRQQQQLQQEEQQVNSILKKFKTMLFTSVEEGLVMKIKLAQGVANKKWKSKSNKQNTSPEQEAEGKQETLAIQAIIEAASVCLRLLHFSNTKKNF